MRGLRPAQVTSTLTITLPAVRGYHYYVLVINLRMRTYMHISLGSWENESEGGRIWTRLNGGPFKSLPKLLGNGGEMSSQGIITNDVEMILPHLFHTHETVTNSIYVFRGSLQGVFGRTARTRTHNFNAAPGRAGPKHTDLQS